MNHVYIAKLNVRHLGCNPLSIQYSKSPNKNLANCIFRGNCQIFDSSIIPRIQYLVLMQVRCMYACRNTFVKVDVTFHFVRCLVIILIVHTDFTWGLLM